MKELIGNRIRDHKCDSMGTTKLKDGVRYRNNHTNLEKNKTIMIRFPLKTVYLKLPETRIIDIICRG